MTNSLSSQYLILLETFYNGIILGIIYHTVTVLVYYVTKKVSISDIFFSIIGGIFTLDVFYNVTYLNLRYYSILGFILGILTYYIVLSKIYKLALISILNTFNKIIKNINCKYRRKKKCFYVKHKKSILKTKKIINKVFNVPININMSYNKLKLIYKKRDKKKHGKKHSSS